MAVFDVELYAYGGSCGRPLSSSSLQSHLPHCQQYLLASIMFSFLYRHLVERGICALTRTLSLTALVQATLPKQRRLCCTLGLAVKMSPADPQPDSRLKMEGACQHPE